MATFMSSADAHLSWGARPSDYAFPGSNSPGPDGGKAPSGLMAAEVANDLDGAFSLLETLHTFDAPQSVKS